MAPKKTNYHPEGVPYKFDRALDQKVRSQMAPQFGADPSGGVVREGGFNARRDAQIKRRKAKGY